MITQSAKLLWLLRQEKCTTNVEIETLVGKDYRKAVQRLRKLGIKIKNARIPHTDHRSVYRLEKDNENIVESFDLGNGRYCLFDIKDCDPISITAFGSGEEIMYQLGRDDRSIWSKIKDWLHLN